MKRLGLVLVALLLVGLATGCIGGNTAGTSSASPSVSMNSTSSTKTTIQPKHYSREELLKNLKSIRQFSYLENTSIRFNVTVKTGNSTQRETMTVIYRRSGYIDLDDKKADVNTTTIVFPGGARTFTRDIIIGDNIYIFLNGRWVKLTNETLEPLSKLISNMTWRYNIVSFTERYLQGKPINETFRNGTLLLYYRITGEDLREMAGFILENGSNITFNVSRGILELRFRNGVLTGGRMGYHMTIYNRGEVRGREASIYEVGDIYDEFVITGINVKKPVRPPEIGSA